MTGRDRQSDSPTSRQRPEPGEGLVSLTASEYATLSAACERILPRDEDHVRATLDRAV